MIELSDACFARDCRTHIEFDMSQPLRVLLLEDHPADARLIESELKRAGYDARCERVDTEQDYLDRLAGDPDLILADYSLPSFDGIAALSIAQEQCPTVPFVFVSGAPLVAARCGRRSGLDDSCRSRATWRCAARGRYHFHDSGEQQHVAAGRRTDSAG